jgi:anti-sigma factor RsiW
MNNQTGHIATDRLQAYVDSSVSEAEREEIEKHMRVCERCMGTVKSMRYLDSSLRRLPLVRVRSDFTVTVMSRLGVVRNSPWLFRVLEKSVYVLGLSIVLGIMLAVFIVTGVVEEGEVQQGQTAATEVLSRVTAAGSSAITVASDWLSSFMPFVFGKGSLPTAIFVAAVLALLALVDRVLARRMFGRTR